MITFVNYSTRTIIFGPAYGTAYKNNALTLSALSTNRVPPCGIEPQPSRNPKFYPLNYGGRTIGKKKLSRTGRQI